MTDGLAEDRVSRRIEQVLGLLPEQTPALVSLNPHADMETPAQRQPREAIARLTSGGYVLPEGLILTHDAQLAHRRDGSGTHPLPEGAWLVEQVGAKLGRVARVDEIGRFATLDEALLLCRSILDRAAARKALMPTNHS